MYVITKKMPKLKKDRVLIGIVVCVKISEIRYAPRIPRIDPIAAPIRRRRLALRRRSSNRITAIANERPAIAPLSGERPNGWK